MFIIKKIPHSLTHSMFKFLAFVSAACIASTSSAIQIDNMKMSAEEKKRFDERYPLPGIMRNKAIIEELSKGIESLHDEMQEAKRAGASAAI